MSFKTEYEFTLPKGYIDENGNLHRNGAMRLATAADEILPMKDPRVQQNPVYLSVIILARVITKLGDLQAINTNIIEGLFSSDFAYLQEFYNTINSSGMTKLKAKCPKCGNIFEVEIGCPGYIKD
ncbi:MAG TPA: phage tail assembly protein [Acetivibrio sp.]|nr:phage tail assembly protein [Clostridium sp.]HQA56476.1 phage tail assembly protein [Acetivibrio sp.]